MLEFHPQGCTNWTARSTAWAARLANIAAHRANVTGIIPALHAVVDGGKLGHNGDGSYENFLRFLPQLKAMGLEVLAFLGNAGKPQRAALEAVIERGPAFIQDAIAMAKMNGYDGYSWDHELHCKQDKRCWQSLEPLEKPYMEFLNLFADTLHQHNLKLSVFIAGCCGFVDPPRNGTHVTGCVGLESTHDFCGTHCVDFSNSSVDRVISGSTYSGSWHDDPATGRQEVWALHSLVAAGKQAIGVPRYGPGLKGGFSPPIKNASLLNCSQLVPPLHCYGPFDDAGRAAIDVLHDMGIVHMAKFMDEPRTEQEWQAWGYHLHGTGTASAAKTDDTYGGKAQHHPTQNAPGSGMVEGDFDQVAFASSNASLSFRVTKPGLPPLWLSVMPLSVKTDDPAELMAGVSDIVIISQMGPCDLFF